MTLFGVLVAVGITAFRRSTGLSSDTIIGIFSAGAVASGLAVIGYLINTGLVPPRGIYQNLLIGNILTIQPSQLLGLLLFFLVALAVEVWAYNRFLLIGLSPEIAQTRGVNVALYEYVFAAVLSVVVMFSIQWVGVLLVTAMLVIPAAAARNFTQSAISVFWLAVLISVSAGVLGLVLSDLLRLTTGATVILCMIGVFVVSTVWSAVRERR
jgi:zinc transport system permease protein